MNNNNKNNLLSLSINFILVLSSFMFSIQLNAACTSPWDSFELPNGDCVVAYDVADVGCTSPTSLWSMTDSQVPPAAAGLVCAKSLKAAGAEFGYVSSVIKGSPFSAWTSSDGAHTHSVSGTATLSSGHSHSVVGTTGSASHGHYVPMTHYYFSIDCFSCNTANISLQTDNKLVGIIPKGAKLQSGAWIVSSSGCQPGQTKYPGTETCVDSSLVAGDAGCTAWQVTPTGSEQYCTPGLKCVEQTPGNNICVNVVTAIDGSCGPNDICGDSLMCKNNKCTDVARNAVCITDTDCNTGELCVNGSSCVAAECHNL